MSNPLVSLRTFLKRAISALAILPVFGFSKPRKFITRVHRDDVIGLHIMGTRGEEWLVTEKCKDGFIWKGERISNAWDNKYWMVDLNNQDTKVLCCFDFDADGYATLHKNAKAFHL